MVKILLLRAQVMGTMVAMLGHRHHSEDLRLHHYQAVMDMTFPLVEMMNHLVGRPVLTDLTDLTVRGDLEVQGGQELEWSHC